MPNTRESPTLRAASARIFCQARYENATRERTHTCRLPGDHEGAHVCPLCGTVWERPGGPTVTTVDHGHVRANEAYCTCGRRFYSDLEQARHEQESRG